jgi:hypothetical protein
LLADSDVSEIRNQLKDMGLDVKDLEEADKLCMNALDVIAATFIQVIYKSINDGRKESIKIITKNKDYKETRNFIAFVRGLNNPEVIKKMFNQLNIYIKGIPKLGNDKIVIKAKFEPDVEEDKQFLTDNPIAIQYAAINTGQVSVGAGATSANFTISNIDTTGIRNFIGNTLIESSRSRRRNHLLKESMKAENNIDISNYNYFKQKASSVIVINWRERIASILNFTETYKDTKMLYKEAEIDLNISEPPKFENCKKIYYLINNNDLQRIRPSINNLVDIVISEMYELKEIENKLETYMPSERNNKNFLYTLNTLTEKGRRTREYKKFKNRHYELCLSIDNKISVFGRYLEKVFENNINDLDNYISKYIKNMFNYSGGCWKLPLYGELAGHKIPISSYGEDYRPGTLCDAAAGLWGWYPRSESGWVEWTDYENLVYIDEEESLKIGHCKIPLRKANNITEGISIVQVIYSNQNMVMSDSIYFGSK